MDTAAVIGWGEVEAKALQQRRRVGVARCGLCPHRCGPRRSSLTQRCCHGRPTDATPPGYRGSATPRSPAGRADPLIDSDGPRGSRAGPSRANTPVTVEVAEPGDPGRRPRWAGGQRRSHIVGRGIGDRGLDELLEHGVVHGDQRDLEVAIRHAGKPYRRRRDADAGYCVPQADRSPTRRPLSEDVLD